MVHVFDWSKPSYSWCFFILLFPFSSQVVACQVSGEVQSLVLVAVIVAASVALW